MPEKQNGPKWWQTMLLCAMAGGMGWGIRGQYGHETGAMIAGLLVSLTIAVLFLERQGARFAARTVAWCTVAMGFGGSETYGQTVGLSHNPLFVGNWSALSWGMLGLSIKGGVWIGFAGLFLGMSLSGVRYRTREILVLTLTLIGLYYLGNQLVNEPFDPAHRRLPSIYFSASWHWEPNTVNLKPRPECWGGLWLALLGAMGWSRIVKKDGLALRLALWGILGGALGFPMGQSLQAWHAWNLEWIRQGSWKDFDKMINWWNMMETTFGAVMGACLGLGVWLNRERIPKAPECEIASSSIVEWSLLAVHAGLLVCADFINAPAYLSIYDLGLIMGVIPLTMATKGRWWPWLVMLPVTAMPILGKTVRQLVYKEDVVSAVVPWLGWSIYLIVPLLVTMVAAVWLERKASQGLTGREMARRALFLAAWLYYGLNFAFFHFPWPWQAWTARTPNALIFTVCLVGLSWACWRWSSHAGQAKKE